MLLVGNGMLITRDAENPWYEDGAVLIDGDDKKMARSLTFHSLASVRPRPGSAGSFRRGGSFPR